MNVYFEMVLVFMMMGFDLWEDFICLFDVLYLWCGMVVWFGGFMMWIVVVVVFVLLSFGGFEVIVCSGFVDYICGMFVVV